MDSAYSLLQSVKSPWDDEFPSAAPKTVRFITTEEMLLLPPRSPWGRFLLFFGLTRALLQLGPPALGEAMCLKPADTKQDMFVQVRVTLERGSEMFSHAPSSASPIYGGHLAARLRL